MARLFKGRAATAFARNLCIDLIAGADFSFVFRDHSFDMAHPPGHPQPIRQDYDNDSETASPYASTTRLAGNQNYYDHNPYNRPSFPLSASSAHPPPAADSHSDAGHGSRSYAPSIISQVSQAYGSPFGDPGQGAYPYPAWAPDKQIPISMEEIEDIFLDLTHKFGFQRDSMRNMVRSSLCPLPIPTPHLSPV